MELEKLIFELDKYDKRLASNQVLHRIGLHLTNRMKMEVTRLRAIDSGRLRNSIAYRINGRTLEVGPFGVGYAKYVEFGTKPSVKMARFLYWRMSKLKGVRKSKGVIEWGGEGKNRTARILPRPFFYNTLEKEKDNIHKIMMAYYATRD